MKNRMRKPVILFFASFLLIGAGMILKMQHWQHADTVFGAGMIVQMFSILWLMVVIMRPEKKGE